MFTLEDHKMKFNEAIVAEQVRKGKNSRVLSKENYMLTVDRLKQLESASEQNGFKICCV